MPQHALPPQEETVAGTLAALEAAGYSAQIEVVDHLLRCGSVDSPAWEWVVEAVYRFEGDSDPADESIVLALRHAASGTRGSLVSAYGPTGSAEEDHVLQRLLDPRVGD